MDLVNLHKMASNAKVNKSKLQAFLFKTAYQNKEEALSAVDFPFPTIGDPEAKITHLGYPSQLDGASPHAAIDCRISAVQAKINILSTTKSALFNYMQDHHHVETRIAWDSACILQVSWQLPFALKAGNVRGVAV